jgi:DNA repair exonuclease SbcCD ATPase subunit
MQLTSLEFRGITRFNNTVKIPFSDLKGVIALVGENGSGKTTTMESIFAGLYRELPSREGNLADHSNGKDAYIDMAFDWGGSYRSLIKIDAEKRTQEAYLYRDGEPLNDGKVTTFDAKIAELFLPRSLFLMSAFSAQNKNGSFLSLSKVDKKKAFADMLGLGEMQKLADKAGEIEKELTKDLGFLEGNYQAKGEQVAELDTLHEQYREAQEKLLEANDDLGKYREREEKLIAELARMEAERGRRDGIRSDMAAVDEEIKSIDAKLQINAQAVENNQKVMTDGDRIQKAVERVAEIGKEIAEYKTVIAQHEATRSGNEDRRSEVSELITKAERLEGEANDLERTDREQHQTEKGKLEEQLKNTELSLSGRVGMLNSAKASILRLEKEIATLEEQSAIRSRLSCGDSVEKCELAEHVNHAISLIPMTKETKEAKVKEIEQLLAEMERLDKSRKILKEQISAMSTHVVPSEVAEKKQDAEKVREEARNIEANILKRKTEIDNQIRISHTKIADLESELMNEQIHARLSERLSNSAKRLSELEEDANTLRSDRLLRVEKQGGLMRQLEAIPSEEAIQDLKLSKELVAVNIQTTDKAREDASSSTVRLKTRIAELTKIEETLDGMSKEIAYKRDRLACAKHLAFAFGRDGIQALEIDAAGPEVSAIVNELLSECFGTRFSVSIVTTKPKSSGKGTTEVFDLSVIDNDRQREGSVSTLSGGETVIVNEAISLGLSIFNARKNGRKVETILRDETSGALDPQNAMRYMAMLKKAFELSGVDKLIFIAHQPELWEAADHRLFVRDGRVDVD